MNRIVNLDKEEMTLEEANEVLANARMYTTLSEAENTGAVLDAYKVGEGLDDIVEARLPDGWLRLKPPAKERKFYFYLFNNGTCNNCGNLRTFLGEQWEKLWRVPLIGHLWKIRKKQHV